MSAGADLRLYGGQAAARRVDQERRVPTREKAARTALWPPCRGLPALPGGLADGRKKGEGPNTMRATCWRLVLATCALGHVGADVNTDWRDGMAPKLDGPYCGQDNCYELLGVPRTAEPTEIRKAYRALAKEAHPDKNPNADRAQFQRIAAAYEVLMSESSRRAYDWGLDNPQILAFHLARYRPVRSIPNADVRLIIVLAALVVSALQWAYRTHNYARGRHLAKLQFHRRFEELYAAALAEVGVPAADAKRIVAEELEAVSKEEAKRAGKASAAKAAKKGAASAAAADAAKPPAASELSAPAAAALGTAEERLFLETGLCNLYTKPELSETFAVQLALSPVTLARWLAWYVRWLVMVRATPRCARRGAARARPLPLRCSRVRIV